MIQNHFTATGIVFNSKNEILLIRHNKLKVWLPPGGHIDENELPDDAVIREVYEETGIKAEIISVNRGLELSDKGCRELMTPFTILLEDIEGNGKHNHIDMIYLCRAINENLTPQTNEVSAVGWFACDKISGLDTFENVSKTISKAMAYLKKLTPHL